MKKTSPSHGSEDSEDGVCMTEAECGLHLEDGGWRMEDGGWRMDGFLLFP